MKINAVSFVAGLFFAIGLALAGMAQPSTVVGFLDVFGRWNPSLALVMMAGIPMTMIGHQLSLRRAAPIFADTFPRSATRIDGALLLGAAIFGVGWGLAGICPGPALLALSAGLKNGVLLVFGMVIGFLLFNAYDGRSRTRQRDETAGPGLAPGGR